MQGHRRGGVISAWLDNGLRVHHLKVDLPPDQVVVSINLIGSELLETAENRGVSVAAGCALNELSRRGDDPAAARARLQTRDVRVEAAASPDALVIRVWGSRSDLDAGLRSARDLITVPRVFPSALQAAAALATERQSARIGTVQGVIADAIAEVLLPPGEPRTRPLTPEEVSRLDDPTVQSWLDRHTRSAPIEVAVVGDIPFQQAMAMIVSAFGDLPARPRIGSAEFVNARELPVPPVPIDRVLRRPAGAVVSSESSLVLVGFLGPAGVNPAEVRTLRVAAKLIDRRATELLRSRGISGGNIGVSTIPGTVYPNLSAVVAAVRTTAGEEAGAADAIELAIKDLAEAGASESEVDSVGDALASAVEGFERAPRYWSDILARSTTMGVDPEQLCDGAAFYRAISAREVNAAMRKLAVPDRFIRVIIRAE